MPEDLAKFLGKDKVVTDFNKEATGSFACQECLEIVQGLIKTYLDGILVM